MGLVGTDVVQGTACIIDVVVGADNRGCLVGPLVRSLASLINCIVRFAQETKPCSSTIKRVYIDVNHSSELKLV